MNRLIAKTKIRCATCGCVMTRVKTIKVDSSNKEDAIKQSTQKIEAWKKYLEKQNCKICQSIINDLGKDNRRL